eukprot:4717846-Amphidinium_carterae.1
MALAAFLSEARPPLFPSLIKRSSCKWGTQTAIIIAPERPCALETSSRTKPNDPQSSREEVWWLVTT